MEAVAGHRQRCHSAGSTPQLETCPAEPSGQAHATTRSRRVEISISFPHHSEQDFSFMFLNSFISPPTLKTERPPGIRSHVHQHEALTGSLLLFDLALRERCSEAVQGKDKHVLPFKLRVDPHLPKASAEDPAKQTLTSRLAPKGSCPQGARRSQVPVQNGAVNTQLSWQEHRHRDTRLPLDLSLSTFPTVTPQGVLSLSSHH